MSAAPKAIPIDPGLIDKPPPRQDAFTGPFVN